MSWQDLGQGAPGQAGVLGGSHLRACSPARPQESFARVQGAAASIPVQLGSILAGSPGLSLPG